MISGIRGGPSTSGDKYIAPGDFQIFGMGAQLFRNTYIGLRPIAPGKPGG